MKSTSNIGPLAFVIALCILGQIACDLRDRAPVPVVTIGEVTVVFDSAPTR